MPVMLPDPVGGNHVLKNLQKKTTKIFIYIKIFIYLCSR